MELTVYERALQTTLGYEGHFSNHPKDKGGETWMGISRVTWPEWEGWPLVDNFLETGKLNKYLLEEAVSSFYFVNYWMFIECHNLRIHSEAIAAYLFDIAVQKGQGDAGLMLQRALNDVAGADLIVDGVVGSKTIAAFESGVVRKRTKFILNHIICQRAKHVLDSNLDPVFYPGVMERVLNYVGVFESIKEMKWVWPEGGAK